MILLNSNQIKTIKTYKYNIYKLKNNLQENENSDDEVDQEVLDNLSKKLEMTESRVQEV